VIRIAIVGGGPGGLLTSYLLDEFHHDVATVTLFEACSRLGGKFVTGQFERAPVRYEAGVAELYDYSRVGPDPIRELVAEFGLETTPMVGKAVILDGRILRNDADFGRIYGANALRTLLSFYAECTTMLSPRDYYEDLWTHDNAHPLANVSYADFLDAIGDESARRYVEIAARSDVATEPHLTSALNGLKNILMDHPGYMSLYSLNGGNQRFTDEIAARLSVDVMLDTAVTAVIPAEDGTFTLVLRTGGVTRTQPFDIVVLAMPNPWVQRLGWGSPLLRHVMQGHLGRYDRPAHYLRVSVLLERPFWRLKLPGSYAMSDAFGGCCIYDEGRRHPSGRHGVLNWLIAGNDALMLSCLDDERLLHMVLDSLPEVLAEGRGLAIEARVHRWTGAINGLPGGNPVLSLHERHQPDPVQFPGLYVVGDYLFDSTINGVYDSANYVSDLILTRLRKLKYLGEDQPAPLTGSDGQLDRIYHDMYDGSRTYEESLDEYFDEYYVRDLIAAVWGYRPPYKLLDCGSANGLTLLRFEDIGIEAWGIENSAYIHARTPPECRERNILGDVRQLPFPDGSFDFVYETCLCYLAEEDVETAIRELFRVCRIGVFMGGITSDMMPDVIEQHDIFEGVNTLTTLWDWSEKFIRQGFRIATCDPKVLARAWKIEVKSNEGGSPWYPGAGAMRYCFYSKPDAPAAPERPRRPRQKRT
jgi:protoporphyrinogen oxidase/SAM-dependent methyltransferase